MRGVDLLGFALRGLSGHGLRTGLSLLGVTIGVAAVVVLTAMGDGARLYVVDQFASLGTNLVIIVPGRTDTTGIPGFGGIPHDLTLADAAAVDRQVRQAVRVAPISMGTDEVAFGERRRQVAIVGTTPSYLEVRQLEVARGRFLPVGELDRGAPVAVLGRKVARELFPGIEPIGQVVRVGGWRMRVIGVMAAMGTKLGLDFDEVVIVPVATGMKMLNRSSLFRVVVQVGSAADVPPARAAIRELIRQRHGEEDVTVITQDAVLTTFAGILTALTLALTAIAAVSLTVAGIGIMNVMLVAVSERTREVGLLKALGVARGQILLVFLAEAALISTAGGLLGLAAGWAVVGTLVGLYPQFPASPPTWAMAAALGVSLGVGLLFGWLPARRATRLDPVAALTGR